MTQEFLVRDNDNDNERTAESRSKAEDMADTARELGSSDVEVLAPGEWGDETATDGGDVATEPCGVCGESVAIPDATAGPGGQPSHEVCVDADDDPTPGVDECVHCGEPIEDGWCPECDGDNSTEVIDAAPAPDTDHEPEALSADEIEQAAGELDDRHVDEDPIKWLPGEFVDRIDGSPAINRKGFEVLGHFYDVDVNADLEVAPEDTDHEYARVKATATRGERVVEAYGSAHVDRGDDHYLLLEMADTRARKRALSIATGAGAVAVDELINSPEGQQ